MDLTPEESARREPLGVIRAAVPRRTRGRPGEGGNPRQQQSSARLSPIGITAHGFAAEIRYRRGAMARKKERAPADVIGRRSSAERELLGAFERRRQAFEAALEASNIIHHKHTCPCCGLPTLDHRGDCDVCVVCLWEDCGGEAFPRRASPPNYVALERARLAVAEDLRVFEAEGELDLCAAPIDPLVRAIKRFEAALRRGEASLDCQDLAANLAQILAS